MSHKIFYRIANNNDIDLIPLFLKEFFPIIGWNKKFIEWEYFNNPFGKAKVFIALSNYKLVGLSTSIPIKMKMNNKIFDGYRNQHALTNINYRGQGIFSKLLFNNNNYMDKYTELNITFPNEQSVPFFIKTNWSQVSLIPLLEKKITKIEKKSLKYNLITEFKNIHQDLWEKNLNNRLDILCSKNYLNWRYVFNPKSKYTIFEIKNQFRPIGFIILKEYLSKNKTKIGHICQLVCPKNYILDAIKFANNFFYNLSINNFSIWTINDANILIKYSNFKKVSLKNRIFLYRSKKKINKKKWNLSMSYSDVY